MTVSRVLNNGANVRPETRERVRRAVEELGYSVNQQARALASGMGRQIMLIHAHSPELEPNSYYNAGLELGALRGCSSLGFDLVTRAIDPHERNRVRLLASILERERPAGTHPVSAAVGRHRAHRGGAARGRSGRRGLGRRAGAHRRDPRSGLTNAAAGCAIGQHLASLGHRRLGFIKGPPEHQAAALRYEGFLDALREAGIDERAVDGDRRLHLQVGRRGRRATASRAATVTALACANDDMAAGAMLALHRAGLEIPAAMSVTGFDDTPMSEIVWPPLTTIRQPIKDFAERAVHLLFDSQPNGAHPI